MLVQKKQDNDPPPLPSPCDNNNDTDKFSLLLNTLFREKTITHVIFISFATGCGRSGDGVSWGKVVLGGGFIIMSFAETTEFTAIEAFVTTVADLLNIHLDILNRSIDLLNISIDK